MRRFATKLFVLGGLALAFGACDRDRDEEAVPKVEKAVEDTGETIERGAEDVGEEVEEGAEEIGDEAEELRDDVTDRDRDRMMDHDRDTE